MISHGIGCRNLKEKQKPQFPRSSIPICALFLSTTDVIGAEPYLSQDYLKSDPVHRI